MNTLVKNASFSTNKRWLSLCCLGIISSFALISCSQINHSETAGEVQQELADLSLSQKLAPADELSSQAKPVAATKVPKSTPKLIKKAALTLLVESSEPTVEAVSAIIKEKQGYVIDFQDNKLNTNQGRQIVSLQIRIPQAQLDATLEEFTELGTVKSRSLTAEDVSEQIVDAQARLRNLRKQEELVLKIMERSGSVGDVLKAAQELSRIRESIERIDAQLKNLQTQVAYSTIYLNLEAAIATSPNLERPTDLQLTETWQSSTRAVKEFTFGLLKMGIWLVTFSPYLLVIAVSIYGLRQLLKRKSVISESNE